MSSDGLSCQPRTVNCAAPPRPPLVTIFILECQHQYQRGIQGDSETCIFRIFKQKMAAKYNKNLKHLARKLRKHGTKGEAILWRDVLKAKQLWPYQFNRQYPLDNYIVDFISRKLKLIIEVDGSSHIAKDREDYDRQKFLEDEGYTVLRFSESRVIYRIDEVVAEIDYAIKCIERDAES